MIKSQFSVKFQFKWTFNGKLIYAKTREIGSAIRIRFSTKFRKIMVQYKIPFQVDFFRAATTLTAKKTT